ncbi:MAG TPA: 5'(3')-deoxyribonucleotidase [Chitinophagaceae bacterium]|nr:5'(3')-deoxyribonucleotidase [Chitinophagaceae bacterium]
MERIAVDMDGVLADVTLQFLHYHEKDFGTVKSIEEITGLPEFEAFPNGSKHVHSDGFFRNAPVMPGSQEVLKKLNAQYELFIVSAATEFPASLSEKQQWLNEHFPFITWKQIVFCGLKTIVNADIMIDDHLKNLDHFTGTTILFTQPHNTHVKNTRHKRVHSWNEIATILL